MKKFFEDNNYRNIAVYGVGVMTEPLCREIKDTVKIEYFIDANSKIKNYNGKSVIQPNEISEQKDVDAIIVTTYCNMYEVEKILMDFNVKMPVISLLKVIFWDCGNSQNF